MPKNAFKSLLSLDTVHDTYVLGELNFSYCDRVMSYILNVFKLTDYLRVIWLSSSSELIIAP